MTTPGNLEDGGFEAVILDLDGVVTDTESLHFEAWTAVLEQLLRTRLGPDAPPFTHDDYLRHVDGKARLDGIRDFSAARGLELPEGDEADPPEADTVHGIAQRKNRWFQSLLDERGARVFDDAVRALDAWRAARWGLAVVSSSKNCQRVLERVGLADRFDVRVDGIVADELGLAGKPAPDLFVEAARQLDVEPRRAVVIEDAEAGVQAASRSGFGLVVGVARKRGGDHLRRYGADRVVDSLDALLARRTPP